MARSGMRQGKLNHYRSGVGTRAKTDMADARLILRYLTKELE